MFKMILLSMFFTLSALAVQPSAVPSFGLCGGQTNSATSTGLGPYIWSDARNSAGFFTLNSSSNTTTAGNTRRLLKNGSFTAVPTGKAWECYCAEGLTNAANTSYQLVSSATTFADDAASITSGTFQSGVDEKYVWTWYSLIWSTRTFIYRFPADHFPGYQASGDPSFGMTLHCREVTP